MKDIHFDSISAPFSNSGAAALAVRVIAFASTTGLLENVNVHALDMPTWTVVLKCLRALGIGSIQGHTALGRREQHGQRLSREIGLIYDAIEASPMPAAEWASMRELLKDDLLERLLNVSRQSILRYASGQRVTPAKVADRLHAVALIASDLAGSYNEFGIRRWFDRPRAQLAGKAPADILAGDWVAHARMPHKVRELAGTLVGAQAA